MKRHWGPTAWRLDAGRRSGSRGDGRCGAGRAPPPGSQPNRWSSTCRPAPGVGPTSWPASFRPLFQKNNIIDKPFIVTNRSGGAGAEGFLHVKGKAGDDNTIIITLDNLFTTPLATGVPFNWKDLTPICSPGPRLVCPLGECGEPVQDGQGVLRRGEEGARQVQDGRHGHQAGRSDHHRPVGAGLRR